jgi:hypothetical protein
MWLNSAHSADTSAAPLPELIAALHGAVKYISERKATGHDHHCDCETCQWLPSARSLLRSLDDKT